MAHVKTVVSLRKDVFDAATKMARERKVSRSALFEQALDDFFRLNKRTQTRLLKAADKN